MDCPEDVPAYIHRVGRTARFSSGGKSVLFVMPSEMKMIQRLEDAKIPIHSSKVGNIHQKNHVTLDLRIYGIHGLH